MDKITLNGLKRRATARLKGAVLVLDTINVNKLGKSDLQLVYEQIDSIAEGLAQLQQVKTELQEAHNV
ncbi:MAG: hypothetical protein ACOX8U_06535 [Bradymonadia bacterium]|jgi:hypothetical protein